ncbi:MAG: hypothetical protein ACJAT2_000399 [Bacteriovoracaceae bacterium]|jgi:hypothetical protein
MKLSFLILLTALCLSLPAFAENAIAVGGAPEEAGEELGVQGALGASIEDLEFILKSPEIQANYEGCKGIYKADTLTEDVTKCLWGETSDPKAQPFKLSESQREELTERMSNLGGSTDPEANKLKFESLDNGFLKQVNQEPSFQALQEHMKKKLEETIYGKTEKEKKLAIADHSTFHKLFKSQLTKNVIQAMSSYCLDADPANGFLIPKDEAKLKVVRDKNLKTLADAPPQTGAPPAPGAMAGSEANFNRCITSLKQICYKKRTDVFDYSNMATDHPDYYPVSGTRSCNVITYIKQLKQNIIAVNDIESKLDAINKKNGSNGAYEGNSVENFKKAYQSDNNESLTVLSSKEFVETSGFKDAVDTENSDFEKCFADGAVVDPKFCEKYLDDKKEENTNLIAEAGLRARVLKEKMKKAFAEDKEKGIKTYLADQAYSEKEIEEILSKNTDRDKLINEITNRYDSEREAYIATLSKKIRGNTKSEDDFSQSDNVSRLESIRKELTNKTKHYTELVHFTNIVSGYLKITTEGSDEEGRNTTSLAIELGDSAYDPTATGRTPGNSNNGASEHITKVEEAAAAIGVKAEVQDGQNKNSSISAENINKIFNYDE